MREYFFENGQVVDLNSLKSPRMSRDSYAASHEGLSIMCHDVFIKYRNGMLLVVRDNHPYKGELWCLGGRVERGMKTKDSLRVLTKREANLELEDITFLDSIRMFAQTDPFGHGRGSDTPIVVYFARGGGNLRLDELHKDQKIVTPSEYPMLRDGLHPYIQDFMDISIDLIKEAS